MKACRRCGEEKPHSEFHANRDPTRKDGLCSYCKSCAVTATREWRHNNPEQTKKYWPRQRAKDGLLEHKREKERLRRAANPDLAIEAWRRWHEDHPEASRTSGSSRRARVRGQFVEHVVPLVVLERDDGACRICGEDVDPMNFHVDHIVALVAGGEHSYANVQLAHPACNLSKGIY